MARKKAGNGSAFILFDIIYSDGSRSSNRKVPADALQGLDGDAPAKAIIEAQDEKVASLSGRPRREIKSIARSD